MTESSVPSEPTTWRLAVAVPAPHVALFEAALDSLGGALVSAADPDAAGQLLLESYLSERPDGAAVAGRLAAAAAAAGCAPPEPYIEALVARDWVQESQDAQAPLHTNRFWIHGSHYDGPPPAGLSPLLVEASLAFGTGRHETTLGCLLAMEDLVKRHRPRAILDMGCGSGILGLAAAELWPVARVLGIDNDPVAIAVARRHAGLNRLSRRVTFVCAEGYRPAALRGQGCFDLVLANILARPLAAMARDLKRALAPGGLAVLSGLLSSQERQVLAPHEALGLRLVRRQRLAEWAVLTLRRPLSGQAASRGLV